MVGDQPRVDECGHPGAPRERSRAARAAANRQLGLERTLGGGPADAGLGDQPGAAVEVAEAGSGLDLTAGRAEEADPPEGAERQRRSQAAPTSSVSDELMMPGSKLQSYKPWSELPRVDSNH